jgi:hypothetical protein
MKNFKKSLLTLTNGLKSSTKTFFGPNLKKTSFLVSFTTIKVLMSDPRHHFGPFIKLYTPLIPSFSFILCPLVPNWLPDIKGPSK